MKFSIILCLLFCLAFLGHCVERESIEDLLERNIAQKKKFVDVVFVADTSVTKQEFKQQIAAIKVLSKNVDELAPVGEKKSRLAFVQYSDKDKVVPDILLGVTKTRKQFEKKLNRLKQTKGKNNNLTSALFMAYFNYMYRPSTNENRPNTRLVWLTTNGKHKGQKQTPGMPARLLKAIDAEIVVIAIGIEKRHIPELQSIASGRDNFRQYESYLDYFKDVKKKDKKKDDA